MTTQSHEYTFMVWYELSHCFYISHYSVTCRQGELVHIGVLYILIPNAHVFMSSACKQHTPYITSSSFMIFNWRLWFRFLNLMTVIIITIGELVAVR